MRKNLHTRILVPAGQIKVIKQLFTRPENQTQPKAPHLRIFRAYEEQNLFFSFVFFFFLNLFI